VGFSHPRVREAIQSTLKELPFCTRRYTNIWAIRLARKLTELAPGDLKRVLFAPGGAEAISMAIQLARLATGRFKTISLWDAFHGATLDAISQVVRAFSGVESALCFRAQNMFLRPIP
jgi:4-aminobutyrate aminotransferase